MDINIIKRWPSFNTILVMYRNGSTIDMDGRHAGIIAGCVREYMDGGDWWPLKHNESVWIVPQENGDVSDAIQQTHA